MEERMETRLERRWIPAFAGMTPGRSGQMFPETQLRNPSRMHCFIPRPHRVIPAKAGIHAFYPVTKHRNENAANGNNP